MKGMNKTG